MWKERCSKCGSRLRFAGFIKTGGFFGFFDTWHRAWKCKNNCK